MNFFTVTAAVLLGLLLLLLGWVPQSTAEVVVIDRRDNRTLDVMVDMPSTFGPQLSLVGIKGLFIKAKPIYACGEPIAGPPPFPKYVSPAYSHWIVLIYRGNCTFSEKVGRAQMANYSAAIVMNIGSDFIEPMSADDGDNITIPSVFIGQSDGDALQMLFSDYRRIGVIVSGDLPNIESYLLPFAITVAVCFVGMLLCMIVKCIRDYRRSMRHRLSWRALRKLPQHKFKAGVDTYDMCAICLDEYIDGDKLRILPCNHAYHSRCIDPWLTKRRRVCPVCKQKVRTPGERYDDTDEEDIDPDTERAPLLQQATQVSAGTFSSNRENPFMRATRRAQEANARRPNRSEYNRMSDDSASDEVTAAPSSSNNSSRRGSTDKNAAAAHSPAPVHASAVGDDAAGGHTSAAGASSMLPAEDECLDDQLNVVSVTRSAKKKKKSKKAKERSEEEANKGGGEESDVSRSVVLQVEPSLSDEGNFENSRPSQENPVV